MKLENLKKNIDLKLIFISVFYFCVMFFFLFKFGINIGGEAFKYLLDAKSLLNGQGLNYGEFSYFYISYSFLIAVFLKLKIDLVFLSVFQISLSFAAGFCLYKLLNKKITNRFVSLSLFVFYLFCYPIQKWIFFAYSEGVHTSLVVFGLYFFIKLIDDYSFKNLLLFFLITFLIFTTRPVGIIFILATSFSLIIYFFTSHQKKLFWIFCISAIAALVVTLNSPFRYFINPDSLRRMEVICQVPQKGNAAPYSQFNRTGLVGAFRVVKNEIGFMNFFKTGIQKIQSFFGLTRSYFSFKNNLFLSLFWLFYPFAIIGAFNKRYQHFLMLKIFSVSYILMTSLAIFFTCDDWSDRFIAPVFPFVVLLATMGFLDIYILIKSPSQTPPLQRL